MHGRSERVASTFAEVGSHCRPISLVPNRPGREFPRNLSICPIHSRKLLCPSYPGSKARVERAGIEAGLNRGRIGVENSW